MKYREARRLRRAAANRIIGETPGGSMKREKLSEPEIAARLTKLPGWSVKDGKLHRIFQCKDFAQAWGFMSSCALAAEKLDHHPDWSNSWNKVEVNLVTHSAGGITEYDFALAEKMQTLFTA
jgi:4a-hydroxytetrahydrobiopterin dehydratase